MQRALDAGEEWVTGDRELMLLMKAAGDKDYSCGPKYAKDYLTEFGNKIVPSLQAIKLNIGNSKTAPSIFVSTSVLTSRLLGSHSFV